MSKDNIIQDKSFKFSVNIINLYKKLILSKEFDIARQLLRSGTSIGANIEESIAAQSKKDFLHKVSISLKEARETHYWLRLLKETNLLPSEYNYLLNDSFELINIMSSIVKTVKRQLNMN